MPRPQEASIGPAAVGNAGNIEERAKRQMYAWLEALLFLKSSPIEVKSSPIGELLVIEQQPALLREEEWSAVAGRRRTYMGYMNERGSRRTKY